MDPSESYAAEADVGGEHRAHTGAAPTKKCQIDTYCYYHYLDDLATASRAVLGLPAGAPVSLLQDGWGVHNVLVWVLRV